MSADVNSWDLDAKPRKRRKAVIPGPVNKPEPVEERAVTAPPGTVTGICDATMAIATTGCHWPVGDPRDPQFHYCGAKALKPFGYCQAHETRAKKRRVAP